MLYLLAATGLFSQLICSGKSDGGDELDSFP